MYMNKLPLLMTASVSTRGMVGACFTDEEREKMYRESLMIYEKMLIGCKDVCCKPLFLQ